MVRATMLLHLPSAIRTIATPDRAVALTAMAPAETVAAVCEWASTHGALGLGAFAAAHTLGVVVCFPATLLFEIAAGYAFGVYQGVALAWAAKVTAAIITFLASSGVARTALSNAGVEEAAARAFASQPSLARLTQRVEQDGVRYTLLARLSPIPSWLNNYGLAFAGVQFADYLPATALATLPPVITHVYAGSLLSSLLALVDSDGAAVPPTLAGSALSGLSAIGGALLLREVAGTIAASENVQELQAGPDGEEVRPMPRPRRRTSGDPKASLSSAEATTSCFLGGTVRHNAKGAAHVP